MGRKKIRSISEEKSLSMNDYYTTTDDGVTDKNLIKTFGDWERYFYIRYYPRQKNNPTLKMFLTFVKWHDTFLTYKYTK